MGEQEAQEKEYTRENSPVVYLREKLAQATGFEPDRIPELYMGSLAMGALEFLCGGEKPAQFSDPSKHYARNHVKGDQEILYDCSDGKEKSIDADARLFPITGGFFIGINPLRHKTENDKLRSKWHELAHTLFYEWDGELMVPAYQGKGWRQDEECMALEEELCDRIMHAVFPKPLVLLGGRPGMHYSLAKRLKEEDCDVVYISDESEFDGLLIKTWYDPSRVARIIYYDIVVMDTGIITDETLKHKNEIGGGRPEDIFCAHALGKDFEPRVHGSRAEYFLTMYFYDQFEDNFSARDDTVIILSDDEIADAVEDIVAQRKQRVLLRFPYDIDEVVAEVKKGLDDRFRPIFTPKHF